MGRDPRLREDIAAFESPPAGWDPYLFQIELNPLTDRRIGELFRLEPYVARGVRIGSFVVFPEAEVGAIATNNVFRGTIRHADHALDVKSNVRIVSDWRAHAVEFRAGGAASFYNEFSSEDDRSYDLEARGRVDLTKRTNLEALVSHQRDKDSRSGLDAPSAAAERGDIDTDRVAVAFNHRFNRLSVQLRGSVTEVDYAAVPSVAGVLINNDERDFSEREIAARASWQLNGEMAVFAETALNDREFQVAAADGILRSSDGRALSSGRVLRPLGRHYSRRDQRRLGPAAAQRRPARRHRGGDRRCQSGVARIGPHHGAGDGALGVHRHDGDGLCRRIVAAGWPGGAACDLQVPDRHCCGEIRNRAIRGHRRHRARARYRDRARILPRPRHHPVGRYQHVDFESTAPGSDFTADIFRVGVKVRQ